MKGTRHSLLLIEDNIDDEALFLRAISMSEVPCEVKVVRHGGEAFALVLSDATPVPDIIVLDFHLPGKSGLDILRALRSRDRTRHVPVVMLSALESDTEISACLNEGANSCVQKPMDSRVYSDHVALIVRYWLTVDKQPESLLSSK